MRTKVQHFFEITPVILRSNHNYPHIGINNMKGSSDYSFSSTSQMF
jgi:hypothetical protein